MNCKLILIAHFQNTLLCVAATILNCTYNAGITTLSRIDNTFSAETYLPSNVIYCLTYSANGLLQLVEIAIKIRAKRFEGIIVTLDCRHQQICIVVVGHL